MDPWIIYKIHKGDPSFLELVRIYIRSAHRQFRDLLVTNRSCMWITVLQKCGLKEFDEDALSKILLEVNFRFEQQDNWSEKFLEVCSECSAETAEEENEVDEII